jgi:hypothetical protein
MQQERCSWTSYVTGGAATQGGPIAGSQNGRSIPGALNIELDFNVATQALPKAGAAWLRVWGISKEEISSAANLYGYGIVVYGGFRRGLPLAQPQQSQAPLLSGWVSQCFGNWQGTDLTLEFSISLGAFVATMEQPANFVFSWLPKSQLSDAIRATLASALATTNVTVNISKNLVQNAPMWGVYPTLNHFAEAIRNLTRTQKFQGIQTTAGGTYSGVEFTINGAGGVVVYDNSLDASQSPSSALPGQGVTVAQTAPPGTLPAVTVTASRPGQAKSIHYEDIIGNPTWIEHNMIQFKCPMRSDLFINDIIELPDGFAATAQIPRAQSGFSFRTARNRLTFAGQWYIKQIRHVGNFRQTNADAWVTVINAVMIGSSTTWNPALAPGAYPPSPYAPGLR